MVVAKRAPRVWLDGGSRVSAGRRKDDFVSAVVERLATYTYQETFEEFRSFWLERLESNLKSLRDYERNVSSETVGHAVLFSLEQWNETNRRTYRPKKSTAESAAVGDPYSIWNDYE
jgi:hypothetical protein